MKKIIYIILILLLGFGLVFAQGPSDQKAIPKTYRNKTIDNLVIMPTNAKIQTQAKNTEELKGMIQQRSQVMNKELENMSEEEQNKYRNLNQVRLAIHALLGMENLTGGIGKNVSAIAREFNNSIQLTTMAEERIESRSGFAKFFIGGDKKAADELESEVNKNQERIQELKRLMDECGNECSEEIRNMFTEQIQNMEQEQNRLAEIAQKTKQNKGIFGWIWK